MPAKKKESEKKTENYLCEQIKKRGGHAYKFTSPQRRSVPDRLCILPDNFVFFVECKSEGVPPTDAQQREMGRLREKGVMVFIADTKKVVDSILKWVDNVRAIL